MESTLSDLHQMFNGIMAIYSAKKLEVPVPETEQPEEEKPKEEESPLATQIKQVTDLLYKAPRQEEEIKDDLQLWANRLSQAILSQHENTKEEIKKANVNRANIRRTMREEEELGHKIPEIFGKNLKAVEQDISVLKKEAPRILVLVTVCVKEVFDYLKKGAELCNLSGKQGTVADLPEEIPKNIGMTFHLTTLKVNVFRMTEPYMTISKKQDREFPIKKDRKVTNYLKSIMDNKKFTQYNFEFALSGRTQLQVDGPAYKREIKDPQEVRKIKLWYYDANALLRGIQLFNQHGEVLMETGIEFDKYSCSETDLAEGERIVGYVSRMFTNKNANHHDFQFVIGMKP